MHNKTFFRKHINACFGKIDCYLMPHPGLRVATDPRFNGKLRDIESSFKDHLKAFVPLLLSPANIEVKKISGNEVKCKELVGFFKAYIDIFKVNFILSICTAGPKIWFHCVVICNIV